MFSFSSLARANGCKQMRYCRPTASVGVKTRYYPPTLASLQPYLNGGHHSLRKQTFFRYIHTNNKNEDKGQDPTTNIEAVTEPPINEFSEWRTPTIVPVLTRTPTIPHHLDSFFFKNTNSTTHNIIKNIQGGHKMMIGLFWRNSNNSVDFNFSDIHKVGTLAEIRKYGTTEKWLVTPIRRIKATEPVDIRNGLLWVSVVDFGDPKIPADPEDEEYIKFRAGDSSLYNAFSSLEQFLMTVDPVRYNQALLRSSDIYIAPFYYIQHVMDLLEINELSVIQELLEIPNLLQQQIYTISYFKKLRVLLEQQQEISKEQQRIRTELQQKHTIAEQIHIINRKLGFKDDTTKHRDKILKSLEKIFVPEDVRKLIHEELDRLAYVKLMELNSVKNYLDWLTCLPWGIYTFETYDVEKAEKVLNEEHYGIEEVKAMVLESIAVMGVKQRTLGKIWCLTGPPGVGKTSFAKSIAKALGRKFVRFSVGGLVKVSELKGHRRTYVGSMPGKIIQCLKQVETSNPVMLIDEIDKMGLQGPQNGDPNAAMLEILDPEQNATFVDDYLDIPFDLSKILFICTANDVSCLSAPLLDRMEIINLSGYMAEEKREIFYRFLVPTALKEHGLSSEQIEFDPNVADVIMKEYFREPGVRNLQKAVEKICRKITLCLLENPEEKKYEISEKNIDTFIGKPKFKHDRYYEDPPAGVVMGLGANESGGSGLYVETVAERGVGKSSLTVTGQLGSVMKESIDIAYTFVKNFLALVAPDNNFFSSSALHVNWLHGAVPKEGPSGGCAIATSLLSLALNVAVPADITMTGEITLTGKVLCIGGVKQKTVAGIRAGAKRFFFPKDNMHDFNHLPEHLKSGINVHFVEDYHEIFEIIFPQHARVSSAIPPVSSNWHHTPSHEQSVYPISQ